jgi:hypothetical protein
MRHSIIGSDSFMFHPKRRKRAGQWEVSQKPLDGERLEIYANSNVRMSFDRSYSNSGESDRFG